MQKKHFGNLPLEMAIFKKAWHFLNVLPCHCLLAANWMILDFQKDTVCTAAQMTSKLELITIGVIVYYEVCRHPQSLTKQNFAVL